MCVAHTSSGEKHRLEKGEKKLHLLHVHVCECVWICNNTSSFSPITRPHILCTCTFILMVSVYTALYGLMTCKNIHFWPLFLGVFLLIACRKELCGFLALNLMAPEQQPQQQYMWMWVSYVLHFVLVQCCNMCIFSENGDKPSSSESWKVMTVYMHVYI